jgi:hypothetical protein
MSAARKKQEPEKKRRPPATTPEARENQMIALAFDLAEKQLVEGTASSQVITHYLKLATTREQIEKEKLVLEKQLLKARTDTIESAKRVEELYANALDAMRGYQGSQENEEDDEFDD